MVLLSLKNIKEKKGTMKTLWYNTNASPEKERLNDIGRTVHQNMMAVER